MAWASIDPDPQGPWLAVGCSRAEYHLCEQVPGMNYRKSDGIWRAPLTWPAWVALMVLWEQEKRLDSARLQIAPHLQAWADDQWRNVQFCYRMRAALDAEPPGVRKYLESLDDGRALFPFQRGGAAWLIGMKRGLLEDPQGNGKTPQVIRGIQLARAGGSSGPWLVVAPASALYNWARELNQWAPELTVRVIDGTAARRRRMLMDEAEADVYVIGWKTVRLHTRLQRYPGNEFVKCDEHGGSTGKTVAQCEVHEKELNAIEFAGIVADEAHRMKDAKSKQTRAIWWLAHHAEYFWPVTGTPVADTVADLWPIAHGINPKAFPAKGKYLDLYATPLFGWHQGKQYLGLKPENASAFHASVQPMIRRIPKEIARAQLPGEYRGRMPVVYRNPEMSPAQKKIYDQFKRDAIAELESTTVATDNSAVLFGRMCQAAAASIETEEGEDSQGFSRQLVKMVPPSNKADDLIDFLEDNPGPVVVCMNSPQLLKICESRLAAEKITHCSIRADMSPAERDRNVQWFQAGECRVILMTARTGGESITLTASDTILFLQPDPSFLVNDQVIGRVDRIGQENPVRVIYSITPGTVEERLYQLAQDKESRASEVTRDADLLRWIITGEARETVDE